MVAVCDERVERCSVVAGDGTGRSVPVPIDAVDPVQAVHVVHPVRAVRPIDHVGGPGGWRRRDVAGGGLSVEHRLHKLAAGAGQVSDVMPGRGVCREGIGARMVVGAFEGREFTGGDVSWESVRVFVAIDHGVVLALLAGWCGGGGSLARSAGRRGGALAGGACAAGELRDCTVARGFET